MIVVNETGIYISNGQGATITYRPGRGNQCYRVHRIGAMMRKGSSETYRRRQ